MPHYRGTAERVEKAKALAGVALVHAGLAAVILSGLDVRSVRQGIDRLQTFDISADPPPPPPPPPIQQAQRAKREEGAAGKKAEPSPIVAPQPKIIVPVKSPVVAAPIAGTGSAPRSGAATAGTGTGAGGSGSGPGGGGTGDFSGFTPARLMRNLSRADYRPLAGNRLPMGRAAVSLLVDVRGAPTNCSVSRSSGDNVVDAGLCPLITRRLQFRPARDASGKAIPYRLQYIATWTL